MTATDLSDYDLDQLDPRDAKALRAKQAARKMKDGTGSIIRDRVEPMVDQALTYAGAARERLGGAVRTVADKAREKPATSALAILGVGILVGAVLAITLRRPATTLGGTLRDYGGGLGDSIKSRATGLSGQIRDALRH